MQHFQFSHTLRQGNAHGDGLKAGVDCAQDALIIRLPGLYGKNIRKNFIYDYLNVIPAMLKEAKFEELAAEDPGLRNYYDQLIGEIYEQLSFWSEAEWKAPLKETYILGYYLQKNALYTRNTNTETEE